MNSCDGRSWRGNAILLMHVVPEDLLIADVKKIKEAKTVGG